MAGVIRLDRSIHQVKVDNDNQVNLGQLRELVRRSHGIPSSALVYFGTGSTSSAAARSILVDYEGELEKDPLTHD